MRACVITDLCKGCFNVGVKRSGNDALFKYLVSFSSQQWISNFRYCNRK